MICFNVLGCCVSRDIVSPLISGGRVQIMRCITCHPYCMFGPSPQHKIEMDALNSYPLSDYLKKLFVKDYNKEILEYLFSRRSDYLIVDIMHFRLDVLKCHNHIITCYDFLEHNIEQWDKDFGLGRYEKVSPFVINEYDQIATLDTLADEILRRYTPNQIILPMFNGVEQYFDNEKTIMYFPDLTVENMRKYNLLMMKLKEHFATTLKGCHIIEFPDYVLADKQHLLGLHELHYMNLYYEYAAACIDVIMQRLPDEEEKQKLFLLKEDCSDKFKSVRSCITNTNGQKTG